MPILKPTGLLQVPGLFGGRVTTVVFDQGYSGWLCPAGVTNLLSVYGVGGEGTSDYWDRTEHETHENGSKYNILTTFVKRGVTESTTGENWSALYPEIETILDAVNAGGTGERDWMGGGTILRRYVDADDNVDTSPTSLNSRTRNPLRIGGGGGFASITSTQGQAHTGGGPILYSDLINIEGGFFIDLWCVFEGHIGHSTTGFGFTFPGGQLSGSYPDSIALDPVPASYTNVAVTPGQAYSVNNQGTLIISYITP